MKLSDAEFHPAETQVNIQVTLGGRGESRGGDEEQAPPGVSYRFHKGVSQIHPPDSIGFQHQLLQLASYPGCRNVPCPSAAGSASNSTFPFQRVEKMSLETCARLLH